MSIEWYELNKTELYPITEKEWHLIKELRKLNYGKTHIIVSNENGQPQRLEIEKIKENIKL